MATKIELENKITQLEAENAELRQMLAARDAIMSKSGEAGWLITTPNPRYNGVTAGVEFTNGRGFVPKSQIGSSLLVNRLRHDFGYRVDEVTSENYKMLVLEEKTEQGHKTMIEQLSVPGVMGGE